MKTAIFLLSVGTAFLPVGLMAQIKETPATIALIEGGNPQGFVQKFNEQGVIFATAPGGPGKLIPYNKIRGEGLDKLIRFEDRVEILEVPRALFSRARYMEAAEAFGKVAKDYSFILSGPQNFASEALFYQIESLNRAGQFERLFDLVNSPAAATIPTQLSDSHKRPFEFHKLWALYGKNDLTALKAALEGYQEPVSEEGKLLQTPSFKKLPAREVTQLAFLRGKIYESEGEKGKALEDYYRAFTLTCGNDVLLSKLAMGAAMQIQKEDPRLAQKNQTTLTQMQSIAYLYSRRFGKETMPAEYQAYAVRPEVPEMEPIPDDPTTAPDAPANPDSGGKGKAETPKSQTPKAEPKAAPKAKAK